jgi:hypothetical protein
VTQPALAEPISEAAPSAWRPMSEAPKGRPVLLRSRWAGRPVAIVGRFASEHGSFVTQAIFGEGVQIIHAEKWADLPELEGAW